MRATIVAAYDSARSAGAIVVKLVGFNQHGAIMDILESFKAVSSTGALVEIRKIQTYIHFNDEVLHDGIIYLTDTGEKAMLIGKNEFVIQYLDKPHVLATRLDGG